MDDVRLLPIYTAQRLQEADWQHLRSAVGSLSKDYGVRPCKAVMGSPGYVLAIGTMPDFICDGVALVPNTEVAGLPNAINAVLERQDDGRIIGLAEQLSHMFGRDGVVELEPERIEQTVVFK